MPKIRSNNGGEPTEDANQMEEKGTRQNRPASTSARNKRRRTQTSAEGQPKFMLAEEGYLDDGENSLNNQGEADTTALDDLDVAERFDLGETLNNRGGHGGGSIVELLEEAYDRLALDDADVPSSSRKSSTSERSTSSTKRNGHVPEPANG